MGQCLRSPNRNNFENIQPEVSLRNRTQIVDKAISNSLIVSKSCSLLKEENTRKPEKEISRNLLVDAGKRKNFTTTQRRSFVSVNCSDSKQSVPSKLRRNPSLSSNVRKNSGRSSVYNTDFKPGNLFLREKLPMFSISTTEPTLRSSSTGMIPDSKPSSQMLPRQEFNPGKRLSQRESSTGLSINCYDPNSLSNGFRSKSAILNLNQVWPKSFCKEYLSVNSSTNSGSKYYKRTRKYWNDQKHPKIEEPFRLVKSNYTCSLTITNKSFKLFYDHGDSVLTNLAHTASLRKLKKPWHRSSKVYISGSVTRSGNSFTLCPSKLFVSLCGVEHGLFRRTRQVGATSSGFSTNTFDKNMSLSLESIHPTSSSTYDTLTPYWFASGGFYLDRTYNKAKKCFLGVLREISWHENVAQLLWLFLPESMFKDRVWHDTLVTKRNSPGIVKENFDFKPFSVTLNPASKSWLVKDINFEVYVSSNVDAATSSISLSDINGRFFHEGVSKNLTFLGDSALELKKEEEVRPAKVLQSLSSSRKNTKQCPIPQGSSASEHTSKVTSVELLNNGAECLSVGWNISSLKSFDNSLSPYISGESIRSCATLESPKIGLKYDWRTPSISRSSTEVKFPMPRSIDNFEDRIMAAIVWAMASDENVCRLLPVSKTMPVAQGGLKSQVTSEKMVSRMTIFLRPEPLTIHKSITPIDLRSARRSINYLALTNLRSMSYDDDVLENNDSGMESSSNFQIPDLFDEESNDESTAADDIIETLKLR